MSQPCASCGVSAVDVMHVLCRTVIWEHIFRIVEVVASSLFQLSFTWPLLGGHVAATQLCDP